MQMAKNKMENHEGLNHLMVKVSPKKTKSKVEKPVAFILCIDVSGSMDSPAERNIHAQPFESVRSKLDFVKTAGEKLLDMMRDGDQFSAISFADMARIEYPLTTLSKDNRFQIKDRIRALKTAGCTNISDGLQTCFHQIPSSLKETHHIKIILLSDGDANRGITCIDKLSTMVSNYRKEHVSISAIGVGLQYNSYFMESIATSSGGMFYHLESMDSLEMILTDELKTLATLTTKQAKLQISFPNGLHFEQNMNGFSESENGEVYIGNVFTEQVLLFEFATKEKTAVGEYPITATLTYLAEQNTLCTVSEVFTVTVTDEDEISNLQLDDEVLSRVKEMMTAKVMKESLRSYESGDIVGVDSMVNGHLSSTNALNATYGAGFFAESDLADIQSLRSRMTNNSLSARETKGIYASSYRSLRNESTTQNNENN